MGTADDLVHLASGLHFPEGPVVLPDGDIAFCELESGTVSRVRAGGEERNVIAECGGSPNGAQLGPDGALYVCNSGGWRWTRFGPVLIPGDHHGTQADDYIGGRIQRVDLATGDVTDLYTECDGRKFSAPNDIVFDETGGFWFTDHGHQRHRDRDKGGVFYAMADGSGVREMIWPVDSPNGIGLAPDGLHLYVAETNTGRVYQWDLAGAGQLAGDKLLFGNGGRLLTGLPGAQLLDSLAVDGEGWVCVATIVNGGITAISPDGRTVDHTPLPDGLVTNICFGGDDMRTAYCTLSSSGALVKFTWPRAGLKLAFG